MAAHRRRSSHELTYDVSSDVPLYKRDPAAYEAYLAEGNRT